jgi:hypothetical protein
VTPCSITKSRVTWPVPLSSYVSWVFVNGRLLVGPYYAETVERSVVFDQEGDEGVVIEIHDFPGDDRAAEPVTILPGDRPRLIWNPVEGAEEYRVYHRVAAGAESLIMTYCAQEGREQYEVECPINLAGEGGVWHFFRVEARNAYGSTSARDPWCIYVTEPPPVPAVEVEDGSAAGLFHFSLA